jgi:phage-related protein
VSDPPIPVTHVEHATRLEADGFVHLFLLHLRSGAKVRMVNGRTVTWDGATWHGMACQLVGVAVHAEEQNARPRFQVQNPDGVFSALMGQRLLDGARLERRRVLAGDLAAGAGFYVSQSWRVGRVSRVTRIGIELELRDITDNPNFVIPSVLFTPPDFPVVKIR